ncbi:taurine catabolism dioxygenase TauD [Chromatiales bacterium (ex Bugula neritina AB1)]|nr:taurine catabolism dioxygenase TauD [Chromatiales bacterium (ex Bugula neritina AB1)]
MRGGIQLVEQDSTDLVSKYKAITPVPQQPGFAALIDGLDLTEELTAEVQKELHQALLDFGVLFFNPQKLTAAQHIALAKCFGPLAKGSFFQRNDDAPEIEMIVFDRDNPPEINIWHSDLSWQKTPPLGSLIQITELPEAGGNTCFLSMTKAYEALSPGMKTYLEDLTALHTWEVSGFYELVEKKGIDALANTLKTFRPVEHPVVLTHPESGKKAIYVNETFTKEISGDLPIREGRAMLQFLCQWIQQPEFMVNHKWEQDGLAIWDNRSTQHYACADYWPNRRVTHRVTLEQPGFADTLSPHIVATENAG